MILLCRNHITPPQLCESDDEGREKGGERRSGAELAEVAERQNTHAGSIGVRVREGWEEVSGVLGGWMRRNGGEKSHVG